MFMQSNLYFETIATKVFLDSEVKVTQNLRSTKEQKILGVSYRTVFLGSLAHYFSAFLGLLLDDDDLHDLDKSIKQCIILRLKPTTTSSIV